MADILLIAAGGTIAAEPYGDTPDYVTVKDNVRVVDAVMRVSGGHHVSVDDFAIKDSKDITAQDIAVIARRIAEAPQQHIIITHGTDAMPQNARALKAELAAHFPEALRQKTVVITGAMEPLSHGDSSDGFRNLTDAVEVALHNARPGVSVVMHRQVFDPDRVAKDFEKKALYER